MLLGMSIFLSIPGTLLKIFDATDTLLTVGVPALRIISLSFCMAGASIALTSAFQALGKSLYSMIISIIRQLVFLVPLAYILARYGAGIGNNDLVWWSYPIAEIAALELVNGGRLYFEINPIYEKETREMLEGFGFENIETQQDFYGKKRMMRAMKK